MRRELGNTDSSSHELNRRIQMQVNKLNGDKIRECGEEDNKQMVYQRVSVSW